MKTIFKTLIAGSLLASSLYALAGPDWQAIEHGRKVKLAQSTDKAPNTAASVPRGKDASCPPSAPAKLLDHGPRADVSTYVLQQRWAAYRARARACASTGA